MSDPGVIRGTIDGQEKYCRIPIRSRLYESVMEDDTTELSSEAILAMPHDKAAAVIDAIMADWLYWLKRAGGAVGTDAKFRRGNGGQTMTRKRARKILMSIGTSRNHANWGLTAKPRWKTNAGVVEDTLAIKLYAKLLRARMEGKEEGRDE